MSLHDWVPEECFYGYTCSHCHRKVSKYALHTGTWWAFCLPGLLARRK